MAYYTDLDTAINAAMSVGFTAKTAERFEDYDYSVGFLVGNDWQAEYRPKWNNSNTRCILVARTNSKKHGKCIRTMHAIISR